MTECYPFKPPKVRINYIDFFDNLPHALYGTKYFKEVFKQECLCCSSILCSNNWGPNFGFITILNEIYNIIQKISICKHLYYCDKIIDKYFGHLFLLNSFYFNYSSFERPVFSSLSFFSGLGISSGIISFIFILTYSITGLQL